MKKALLCLAAALALLAAAGCSQKDAAAIATPEPVTALERVVTAEELEALAAEYPNLAALDLRGSDCPAAIADFIAAHPEVAVTYDVDLGGVRAAGDAAALTLGEGDYQFAILAENLAYLPALEQLDLPHTALSAEQLRLLREAYPGLALRYTVELAGTEVSSDTAELDLRALTEADVPAAAAALEKLPEVSRIALGDLPLSAAKTVRAAAPQAALDYTFELFGQTVSADAERLEYYEAPIGNEGIAAVRDMLDVMNGLTYLNLEKCGVDSEVMAELRDDYPETKIVWRVYFGDYFSCLTDEEMIRAIFKLHDDDVSELKYCTDVKYMDIGHNDELHDISFIAYMPKLEICILSGSPTTDLSPFANCPELEFLECVYCCYIPNVDALANCTKLKYLNLSYSQVKDLSPLYDLPLERFMYYDSGLSEADQRAMRDAQPDCWVTFSGLNPYVLGWRYDDQGYTWCDMYKHVREVFNYSENYYNHEEPRG